MATAVRKPFPPIPYGMADFHAIRRDGFLYVDKTRFVRELENERYAFFLRPRRFGKTCWVSVLEHYYDRTRKEGFETLFKDLDIGRNPTANRSSYAVLRLDFSAIGTRPALLEENFEGHCDTRLRGMLEVNADLFPDGLARRILSPPTIGRRLDALFFHAERLGVRLFLLIDEYDNFANTILAGEGEAAYRHLTHGGGFLRDFFATVKAGTASGGLERLFITGVSPVTLDDVTSGFNIGTNIGFEAAYNRMAGFTAAEVRGLVETYRELGVFDADPNAALAVMGEWYNGYRFAEDAEDDVYNTDMVLYYLKHSIPNKRGPRYLIDTNVRVDYAKLRHLVTLADALRRQTSVRDYVQGERLLQGFLAAYLGAASCFVFHTERELGKGYADMVLTPLTVRHPSLHRGYVVELKYLKRSDSEALAHAALAAAKDQLRGYLADERLERHHPSVRFTGLALVFRGWELVAAEAVG